MDCCRSLIFCYLLLVAVSTLAAQDTKSGVQQPAARSSDTQLTATGVAPNDPVISITGFCDTGLLVEGTAVPNIASDTAMPRDPKSLTPQGSNGNSSSADTESIKCKTEVSRAQFEKLADALGLADDRSSKIRTAVRYPELLLYAEKAHELGLDKNPRFQEKLKYTYLQLLWQAYAEELVRNSNDISDTDVEKQYKEHPETFEQVDLVRIFVPKEKKHASVPASPPQIFELYTADELAMKSEAERIRRKALAGGDFEKLEKEAYLFAGYSSDDAPDVNLGTTNRAEIPPEYGKMVFNLKPGQVSELIPAPRGWHIAKVRSRQTIPLSQARSVLQQLRLKELQDSVKSSIKAEFNDAYFNVPEGMTPRKESSHLQ
jgi:hypothetical protein